jgi:hypothetical protein
MSFFKRLFGRQKEDHFEPTSDGKTYINTEKGAYIINKDAEPAYTYSDLTPVEYKHIEASVTFLKDAFVPLWGFDRQPANHPANLDEYLSMWGEMRSFGKFMSMDPDQHAAFLAYNFGQYLVDPYGMKWQTKSDGERKATIVRTETPVEIELYPIDTTLRAIQNKSLAVYVEVEEKLKRTLAQF